MSSIQGWSSINEVPVSQGLSMERLTLEPLKYKDLLLKLISVLLISGQILVKTANSIRFHRVWTGSTNGAGTGWRSGSVRQRLSTWGFSLRPLI